MKALEAHQKRSGRTPPALLSRPKLESHDHRYMAAFDTLSRSRQVGMSSPQPLQLREMLAYFELMGVHERQRRLRYVRILQTLDDVYLAHVLESTKTTAPKA